MSLVPASLGRQTLATVPSLGEQRLMWCGGHLSTSTTTNGQMDEFFQSYCVTVYYLSTNQQKLNFTAFFSHFPSTSTKFSDMQTHDDKKAKGARTDGRTGNVRIHCQLRRIASHINPITWRGRLGSRPDCFQWIDKIGIDNQPDSSLAVFLSGLCMIPLQIENRNPTSSFCTPIKSY